MTKDALILLWCAALAILAGLAALFLHPSQIGKGTQANTMAPAPLSHVSIDPKSIRAKSAILYDAATGEILYAKNPELQLPLASLTKLATALAVLSEGEDRFVTIRKQDLSPEGDSNLHVGDVWRVGDLVAFSLTSSSNDGMTAASQVLTKTGTIAAMNAAAASEGLTQSYYLNPTGLDESPSTAGAYGSALDVALLAKKLLQEHPAIFSATTKQPKPNGKSGAGEVSTLSPLWDVPGLIAAKTGYTKLAGGNLAAVVDIGLGQPIIAVVLGSTETGRFDDAHMLIESARAAQIKIHL